MTAAKKMLSENDILLKLSARVSEHTGNQLGEKHLYLIRARLARRMKTLGDLDPAAYWEYFEAHTESEMEVLTSLLTTHHTFFFREFAHFEYLESEIPKIVDDLKKQNRKNIRIWSAACSRGQEVYSIAMFLSAKLKVLAPEFTFEIFGTDIDAKSVEIAKNGVYKWEELKTVPAAMMADHWQRGTGDIQSFVRVRESLKGKCKFDVDNLLKLKLEKGSKFDFIFCRNVFIYFNATQVETISQNLTEHLYDHGSLILGLSENLVDLKVKLEHVGRSVFKREQPKVKAAPVVIANTPPVLASPPKSSFRIICVDDSPTVLALLKKSLSSDGFQVVATAKNGLEASEKLKTVSVDAMTLDIQMPEQNGVEYLKKNFGPNHPPVIMVSSVSADDNSLALAALSAGAADYVEKPSLGNLAQVSEQLRTKLKFAVQNAERSRAKGPNTLRSEFATQTVIKNLEGKLRLFVLPEEKVAAFADVFARLSGPQPPNFIIIEGAKTSNEDMRKDLEVKLNQKVQIWSPSEPTPQNGIYLVRESDQPQLTKKFFSLKMAALVFGGVSETKIPLLNSWTQKWIGIEDAKMGMNWRIASSSVIPTTSFAYDSTLWLTRV